jgi:hypothetical protein
MNEINITSAQYQRENNREIIATIDGEKLIVSVDPANRHYAEIMRQVDAGELTIADAD